MFVLSIVLMLIAAALPTLAGTSFYGPEVPCKQWMTHGDFFIANCPGPSTTAMTVLDLNLCYASIDGHIAAQDNGHFVTNTNCTFLPVKNGQNYMTVNCPTANPKVNITNLIILGKCT
ncbi:hypothetical protein BKA67DRAFT_693839 [Truncatella angustata]|uniref:Cyanovirin-N domain-containing protein n=1 Tax=Truncatella angustata TaxID=152316 RepID=A0A9P8UEN2_9PEZI|nr:uncharacterized protein BKA67DRAFT_693839 [Truncatella angustata]KAH6648514.1 hypothetical protein BKA67DRAFT_693839 [Truncatella angustata]